jgi:hypothetical protein
VSPVTGAFWCPECFVAEIANDDIKLPREIRQELVGALRSDGMSIRAISDATGASDQTVQRDLANCSDSLQSPAEIKSKDGKTRPARDKRQGG